LQLHFLELIVTLNAELYDVSDSKDFARLYDSKIYSNP